MTTEILLNIIIIIFLIYVTFIKSYVEKKGQHLATKEDIALITKITEESRIEFIKHIEDYKKELNLRYEFIELTKEFKIKLFHKTIVVRQNLIKWVNNQLTPNLIEETMKLLQEIILDLFSNAVLFKQYSINHENILKEFNKLVRAIQVGQTNGNFEFDKTNLENEIQKLQNELLK